MGTAAVAQWSAPPAEKPSMHARRPAPLVVIPAVVLLAAGCQAKEDVVGHYWDIQAKAVEVPEDVTPCVQGQLDATDAFEYRVVYDGNDFELAIGPDVFAAGTTNGCLFTYESIRWTEDRDGFKVSWRIIGEAQVRHGGRNCNAESDFDWEGIERFEVVKSEDPSLSPGCEYHMKLEGKYLEQVE